MPFIEQWRRAVIEEEGLGGLATFAKPGVAGMTDIQPGDRCYVHYKHLVDKWRKESRWTTVHNLLKEYYRTPLGDEDDHIAWALAWQCFFNLHVMEYEKKKREENGDI